MNRFFRGFTATPAARAHERFEEIRRRLAAVPCYDEDDTEVGGNILQLDVNRGRFLKPCPGQKGNVCCGYWVVEWGMGCPYRCQYCVLQVYQTPGRVLWYLNWEQILLEIAEVRSRTSGILRIGTGEFGDSLALEEAFPLNAFLAERLSDWPDVVLEVKSKRAGIMAMRDWPNKERIIAAFSLNPAALIDRFESGTADLESRLAFARQASAWGLRPAFHFDPLLPVPGWEHLYEAALTRVSEMAGDLPIAWFSLGVLRFPKGFPETVIGEYPETKLFFEECYPCSDGKMRMFRPFREKVYRFLLDRLSVLFPKTTVYLCMESPDVWRRLPRPEASSAQLKGLLDSVVE